MNPLRLVRLVLILAPIVLVIDILWLELVMKNFYMQEMGGLLRRDGEDLAPRLGAAMLVYLLIPTGIVLFVRPLLGAQATRLQAFTWGVGFGFVLYGTYGLTNLAVLEAWTLRLTIVDIAWGGVLCGTSSLLTQCVERRLKS